MKKVLSIILACALMFTLVACGAPSGSAPVNNDSANASQPAAEESTPDTGEEKEDFGGITITVSTVEVCAYHIPIYIAQDMGLFDEVGINIDYVGFTGGPVQMEAYESWDIGTTGIGGVLNCLIGHDGILVGAFGTDSGMQNFWAYPDSDIVQAGTGNSPLSDSIYGSAETWKGKTILSAYGDVKHYCIGKVLDSFGLTLDDVNMMWMDASSCLASFWGGTGDVVAVYNNSNFEDDVVNNLVEVIKGNDVDLGLYGYLVANADSLNDPAKAAAIAKVLEIYYEMNDFFAAALEKGPGDPDYEYILDKFKEYSDWCGEDLSREALADAMCADIPYTLQYNVETLFTKQNESDDYVKFVQDSVNLIKFYEENGVWDVGSSEKFAQADHFRFDILEGIYNEK